MSANTKCLCMLFCATSGLNGENLGCDEQEIVVLANLILDINKLKVSLFPFAAQLLLSLFIFTGYWHSTTIYKTSCCRY